jgi:hypothetical protein
MAAARPILGRRKARSSRRLFEMASEMTIQIQRKIAFPPANDQLKRDSLEELAALVEA